MKGSEHEGNETKERKMNARGGAQRQEETERKKEGKDGYYGEKEFKRVDEKTKEDRKIY